MRFPVYVFFFFFSSRRRHTRLQGDWSSDVCSSDLNTSWVSADRRHHLAESVWFQDGVCVDNADVWMRREVQAAIQCVRFAAAGAFIDNEEAAFQAAAVEAPYWLTKNCLMV